MTPYSGPPGRPPAQDGGEVIGQSIGFEELLYVQRVIAVWYSHKHMPQELGLLLHASVTALMDIPLPFKHLQQQRIELKKYLQHHDSCNETLRHRSARQFASLDHRCRVQSSKILTRIQGSGSTSVCKTSSFGCASVQMQIYYIGVKGL